MAKRFADEVMGRRALRLAPCVAMAGAIALAAPARAETPPGPVAEEAAASVEATGSIALARERVTGSRHAPNAPAARGRPAPSSAAEPPTGSIAAAVRTPVNRSQLRQETYLVRPLGAGLRFDLVPGSTPRIGGEDRNVTVRELRVEGAPAAIRPALDELNAALVKGKAGVNDLFAAANHVQQVLEARGFPLARVVIPPQTVTDGAPFRLEVRTLAVGALDVEAVPERLRDLARSRFAPLLGRPGEADQAAIERAAQTLQDQTGLRVTLGTRPDPAGGAPFLTVAMEDRIASAEIQIGGSDSRPFKRGTVGVTAALHSPLGLGERVYLQTTLSRRGEMQEFRGPSSTLLVGLAAPIGASGLGVDLSFLRTHDTRRLASEPAARLGLTTERAALRFDYPIVAARDRRLVVRAGFDMSEQRQTLEFPFDGRVLEQLDIWREATRALRLSLEGSLALGGAVTIDGAVEMSRGVAGLGATRYSLDPSLPLWYRLGSRPDFWKLEARGRVRFPIHAGFQGDASFRAQYGFGMGLPYLEQLPLLGSGAGGAWNPETATGDSGYMLRFEVNRPIAFAVEGAEWTLEPYAFGALGATWLSRPTSAERRAVRGVKYGAGLRLRSPERGLLRPSEFGLEIHRIETNGTFPDHTVVSAQATIRF